MNQRLLTRAGVAFALLGILTFVVTQGWADSIDRSLAGLLTLRTDTSSPTLIAFLQGVSWVGGGIQRYVIVGIFALALGLWHRWQSGAILIAASVLSNMASNGIKDWIARPRPDMVPHLDHVTSMSFPSGHATSAALVYLLFAALAPRGHRATWFGIAALFMLLTGWSRIALGVHWPSDVLGGWLLGGGCALLALGLRRSRAG